MILRFKKYDFTVNSEQCQGNFDCIKNATTKLLRDTTLKDKVWPWQNFDWDYSQYIDNNYSIIMAMNI